MTKKTNKKAKACRRKSAFHLVKHQLLDQEHESMNEPQQGQDMEKLALRAQFLLSVDYCTEVVTQHKFVLQKFHVSRSGFSFSEPGGRHVLLRRPTVEPA